MLFNENVDGSYVHPDILVSVLLAAEISFRVIEVKTFQVLKSDDGLEIQD